MRVSRGKTTLVRAGCQEKLSVDADVTMSFKRPRLTELCNDLFPLDHRTWEEGGHHVQCAWHEQVPCIDREALCRTKKRGHGGRLRRRAQLPTTGERKS